MLNVSLQQKLSALDRIPMLPTTAAQVLQLLEKKNTTAKSLGEVIEKDQALAVRVLKVANSPFYGFHRKINTIPMAIVVLGYDAIRSIILSLAMGGVLQGIQTSVLDVRAFWRYSVYCGTSARFLAKKLGYRVTGEAFVAGLLHDFGIVIIAQYLSKEFTHIRQLQARENVPLYEAEHRILGATHCEIGAWLASKWHLPQQLVDVLLYHHDINPTAREELLEPKQKQQQRGGRIPNALRDINQPLTAIAALSEWFADLSGYKRWARETSNSPLYIPKQLVQLVSKHEVLEPEEAIKAVQDQLEEEFGQAAILANFAV